MAEFFKIPKRSRLDRQAEEEITKKTIILGAVTVLFFGLIVIFGLPLLVKLSELLANNRVKESEAKILPPLPPRLVSTFEATNSAKFDIFGVGEPKVNIELFKDEVSLGKEKADDKGGFSFDKITLDKGVNVFTAQAITDKEIKSEISKSLSIVYDDLAPLLTISSPEGDKVSVDKADFEIVGKTDKGASVTVNGRVAVVDGEGNFRQKVQLNMGKNSLEVVSQSLAGNISRKTVEITYDI